MAAPSWPAPHRSGGTGPAPASTAAGEPEVHPSPALGELFAGTDPEQRRRVLDLGPASRCNLEFYTAFAGGVRFADLRDLAAGAGGSEPDDPTFARRLEALLPLSDRAWDLVLVWDLLNYLNAERAADLVHHVAAVAAPGARLHAMIVTGSSLSTAPIRHEIVGPGKVAYGPAAGDLVAAPDLPPAKVERWLEPFRVTRSIVLRHGVRELLAVLDEPPASVGAAADRSPSGRLR